MSGRGMRAYDRIIGAQLLLVIGWIVAGIVGNLFAKLCKAIHVDTVSTRVGAAGFLQQTGTKLKASDLMGEIIKWVIRLVFIEMAAEQLGMPQVSQIINQILGFIPNIIVAMIISASVRFLGNCSAGSFMVAQAKRRSATPSCFRGSPTAP